MGLFDAINNLLDAVIVKPIDNIADTIDEVFNDE